MESEQRTAISTYMTNLLSAGRVVFSRDVPHEIVDIPGRRRRAPGEVLGRNEGRPYYVGLLKAAELHGATHQAVMEFQVVTDTPENPRRPIHPRLLLPQGYASITRGSPAKPMSPLSHARRCWRPSSARCDDVEAAPGADQVLPPLLALGASSKAPWLTPSAACAFRRPHRD